MMLLGERRADRQVADFLGYMDWFDGESHRLAFLGLAVVVFALITAFGAAIRYKMSRQSRRLTMISATGAVMSVSASETMEPDGDDISSRDAKSKLRRRASILGKRWRKSQYIRDNLLFISSFAKAPRNVGSITPSGRRLGQAMAAELPDQYSICVELGGGTGSLTCAVLAAGVPSDKLIVIERDPRLVARLRKRFPKVTVVEGDAQDLRRILADAGVDHVDAVISGLPLRSLPGDIRRNIVAEVFSALGPGGVFVQFTYWGEPPIPEGIVRQYGIASNMARRVWRNIPPANVWRYERLPGGDRPIVS